MLERKGFPLHCLQFFPATNHGCLVDAFCSRALFVRGRIEESSCKEGETEPTNNSSSLESMCTVISSWSITTKVCKSEKRRELFAAFAENSPSGSGESSMDDFSYTDSSCHL